MNHSSSSQKIQNPAIIGSRLTTLFFHFPKWHDAIFWTTTPQMEYGDLMLNGNYPVGKGKSDRLAEAQVKHEESGWPNSPTRYEQADIFPPEGCDQGAQIRTLSRKSQTPK